MYISQDPIGLMGGRELYKYIHDSNGWVDPFGLMPLGNPVNKGHHVVPHKAATDLGYNHLIVRQVCPVYIGMILNLQEITIVQCMDIMVLVEIPNL
jgi:hypothetical protein